MKIIVIDTRSQLRVLSADLMKYPSGHFHIINSQAAFQYSEEQLGELFSETDYPCLVLGDGGFDTQGGSWECEVFNNFGWYHCRVLNFEGQTLATPIRAMFCDTKAHVMVKQAHNRDIFNDFDDKALRIHESCCGLFVQVQVKSLNSETCFMDIPPTINSSNHPSFQPRRIVMP